ncbi:MAG: ComEC/Rec2 family competence protein [Candidatus Chromulinivorax sp.]
MIITYQFNTKQLLLCILTLIAGIAYPTQAFYSLAVIILTACMLTTEKQKAITCMIACCCFFLGQVRYYQQKDYYHDHQDILYKKSTICATVQEILPRIDLQEQICMLLKIEKIEQNTKEWQLNKNIYIFVPSYTNVYLQPHQKIILKDIILQHPSSESSYEQYLIRENIWAIAHAKKLFYITVQKPSLFQQWINSLQKVQLQAFEKTISPLTQTLYLSIFCGKKIKSEMTTKIKRLFAYFGISHHLARSGLHLIILIGILLFLFSFLPFPSRYKQSIIFCILCGYHFLTYPSVAFLRAFYMYILYMICKQLYLPYNPIHILLLTTGIVLITNPYNLFFLDFQLSFSITLLIIWFYQNNQNCKTVAL